jgi:predicted metal-dependent peptidase
MPSNIDKDFLAAANLEMSRVKIALMTRQDSAFFSTLCFNMQHVWDDGVPTACTDGRKVYWGPKFFMGQLDPGNPIQLHDREERLFAMVHECMHPAYLHMSRMPAGYCHDRWNIAADHVINLQLKERGFKVPHWVHCDPAFTGMSTEEVYKLLPDNPGKPSMVDLKAPPEDGKDDLEDHIKDVLIRARIQSITSEDKPGTIPGSIEIFLNKLLTPKLPWHRILLKFLMSFAKSDYSWKRPNRRYFPTDILPSMYSISLIDLAAFTDTSGSVSDQDFLQYVTEVHSMLRMMKPKKLIFGQFDTSIKSVDEIRDVMDLMKVKFTGRGGTDIEPVMKWAVENKPQLLLVFTDGEFTRPVTVPNPRHTTVIWVIHNNPTWTAPFGKVIHFKL